MWMPITDKHEMHQDAYCRAFGSWLVSRPWTHADSEAHQGRCALGCLLKHSSKYFSTLASISQD